MKPINSYVEFLDELDKGSKDVAVTEEFYEWLKENIANPIGNPRREITGAIYGIRVRKVKADENV